MAYLEKRKNPRIDTNNFISFYLLDEHEVAISEGLGKAKNISKKGMRLMTGKPVESEKILLVSTDEKNNIIEMKGKVVYSIKSNAGLYQTGIEFLGHDDANLGFARSLLTAYKIFREQSELSVRQA